MTNLQRGFAPILIVLIILTVAVAASGGYYVVSKKSRVAEGNIPTASTETESPQAIKQEPEEASFIENQKTETMPSSRKDDVRKSSSEDQQTPTTAEVTVYDAEIIHIGPPGASAGWPIRISASVPIKATLDSMPHMVVIEVVPETLYSAEYTLTISGLPTNTDMHIYTEGYRNYEVKRTSSEGTLIFTLTSPMQFIIKDTPS